MASPQTFNADGTWEVPAGVTVVQVECWGAGGNGGAYVPAVPDDPLTKGDESVPAINGFGGGGGGYSKTTALAVTPGHVYTCTVGQVGDGRVTSFSISSVNNTLANRGSNGAAGAVGIGGTTASAIGDVKTAGANGSGTTGGAAANGGAGGAVNTNGTAPGGGGGGDAASAAPAAGTGAAGRITLTWDDVVDNYELAIGIGAYALTGTDVAFELGSSTNAGVIFDYVLSQESSEAIWPSRMTQMADWAVPAYLSGERVVLYTKSGSNQIWILGETTTGTITSYIDLPWMSRLDDTKVVKWLGLVAAYASTVAVSVYVRYANNPGEFDAAVWALRGTLPANPTIAEGARIGFGGSTRWVQVRFQATTIAAGGFELFPPVHLIPVDTMRSPN